MTSRRPNPFRGFSDTIGELERMRYLGRTRHDTGHEEQERTHATAWVPTTDIFARGSDLLIWMEIPGVPREAIDITYDHSELTVSGERRDLSDEDGLTFWRRERYYGTFRRSMTLPRTSTAARSAPATRTGC